jgi:hypothetical protein
MQFLLKNPEVDVVDTGAYSISENGIPTGKRGLENINTNPKYVLTHAMLLHASVVGKTAWFLKNPYDKVFIRAEDYELWCRTFSFSKFGRVKEPLYIVREGKINVKNYLRSSQTIRNIIKKYGPGILSFFELNKAIAVLRLKEFTYQFFSLADAHHFLVNTRNKALTQQERSEVLKVIGDIENLNMYNYQDEKNNISI